MKIEDKDKIFNNVIIIWYYFCFYFHKRENHWLYAYIAYNKKLYTDLYNAIFYFI